MRNILLIVAIFLSAQVEAATLGPNDYIDINVGGTAPDFVEKLRIQFGSSSSSSTFILGEPVALSSKEMLEHRLQADIIRAYIRAGNSLILPEPVTKTVLANLTKNLREKLGTDAKFAKNYAEVVESKLRTAHDEIQGCLRLLPAAGRNTNTSPGATK